jgi:3-dehydroquinate dehydratase/shikimate dehydrogenase
MTKIIASVSAPTTEEMIRAMRESTDGADIIELRVDALRAPDLERLRAENDKPLILTCRSSAEGGLFRGTEEERLSLLGRAFDLGFDYVDVEMAAWTEKLERKTFRPKLILSRHLYKECPNNLEEIVRQGTEMGADVVKLAIRASSLDDGLRLFEAGAPARDRGVGYIPVSMGPAGMSSRILGPRWRVEFTYASARGLPATGPGQVDLEELLTTYRFRSIGRDTRVYGLVGCPAADSLSPAMHNALFERLGVDAVYVPFEEDDLETFLGAARTVGVDGLSVTRPHKEAIRSHLEDVDDLVRRVGAVNTVSIRDGRWKGWNTDVEGVVEPIAKRTEIEGKMAVVLGAGGAARAAAMGLADNGAHLVVLSRRLEQAHNLAGVWGAKSGPLDALEQLDWDILVNATPVGGGDSCGELPTTISRVKSGSVVLDMVYSPEKTALLEKAREAGAQVISGIEMLAAQAVGQAEIWTGIRPDLGFLEEAARAAAGRRQKK